jgi:hypothetical protein
MHHWRDQARSNIESVHREVFIKKKGTVADNPGLYKRLKPHKLIAVSIITARRADKECGKIVSW